MDKIFLFWSEFTKLTKISAVYILICIIGEFHVLRVIGQGRVLGSDRKSAIFAGKITPRSEITDNLQLNIAGKYNAIIGDHRKVHIRTKENK